MLVRPRICAALLVLLCALVLRPLSAADYSEGLEAFDSGDYAGAVELWRPLAMEGHAQAQLNLALMYYEGLGIPEDRAQAAGWFRKAADQGVGTAQFSLGLMYFRGRGVEQDSGEAARWFRMAAEQDDAEAQVNLGILYGTGDGVEKDLVEAYKWLNLAYLNGDAGARGALDQIKQMMSAAQIAEAKKRARLWRAQKGLEQ